MGSQLNTGYTVRAQRAVAGALAAIALSSGLAAVVGDDAVLAELLVAGPLIAATGATVRQTTLIAILALVLSIPLGFVSDAFGEQPHIV